jgi:hypothetical protein
VGRYAAAEALKLHKKRMKEAGLYKLNPDDPWLEST